MPNSNPLPAFYTEHIPQSEYRRTEEVRSRGDRTQFNTTLESLKITDPELKKELRLRIEQEDAHLAATLLPGSICASMDKAYLYKILDALAL